MNRCFNKGDTIGLRRHCVCLNEDAQRVTTRPLFLSSDVKASFTEIKNKNSYKKGRGVTWIATLAVVDKIYFKKF